MQPFARLVVLAAMAALFALPAASAGAHGGKGRMARSIDERHAIARSQTHLIGTDMLRDTAGFARNHISTANRIKERGFTVINVPHHHNHR